MRIVEIACVVLPKTSTSWRDQTTSYMSPAAPDRMKIAKTSRGWRTVPPESRCRGEVLHAGRVGAGGAPPIGRRRWFARYSKWYAQYTPIAPTATPNAIRNRHVQPIPSPSRSSLTAASPQRSQTNGIESRA